MLPQDGYLGWTHKLWERCSKETARSRRHDNKDDPTLPSSTSKEPSPFASGESSGFTTNACINCVGLGRLSAGRMNSGRAVASKKPPERTTNPLHGSALPTTTIQSWPASTSKETLPFTSGKKSGFTPHGYINFYRLSQAEPPPAKRIIRRCLGLLAECLRWQSLLLCHRRERMRSRR